MKLVSVSPTVVVDPDKILFISKKEEEGVIIDFGEGTYAYVDDATYEQVLKALAKADDAYIDGGGDDVKGIWG